MGVAAGKTGSAVGRGFIGMESVGMAGTPAPGVAGTTDAADAAGGIVGAAGGNTGAAAGDQASDARPAAVSQGTGEPSGESQGCGDWPAREYVGGPHGVEGAYIGRSPQAGGTGCDGAATPHPSTHGRGGPVTGLPAQTPGAPGAGPGAATGWGQTG